MEALYEKYCPEKNRSQLIRELSGWMPKTEGTELREAATVFSSCRRLSSCCPAVKK
jgi:hypothetical protein